MEDQRIEYMTTDICAGKISFRVEDNKIHDITFIGGCSGNAQGMATLLEGMDIGEVKKRLKGIPCGDNYTSCPDQLTKALEELDEG